MATKTDSLIEIFDETVGDTCVMKLVGELDLTSRALVTRRCTQGRARHVIVDLAELAFLDCGGYGAFIDARVALARHSRTLAVVAAIGGPRRLLNLIQHIDSGPGPNPEHVASAAIP